VPFRVSRDGRPIAVEIRCYGKGGRCRRMIGTAAILSPRRPDGAVLHVSNGGWQLDHGYPRWEDRVPADFSGETGVLRCPKHRRYLHGEPTGPPRFRGFPPEGVTWIEGMTVCLPNYLLREPYERALRTGHTQTIAWLPGVSPTVIRDP